MTLWENTPLGPASHGHFWEKPAAQKSWLPLNVRYQWHGTLTDRRAKFSLLRWTSPFFLFPSFKWSPFLFWHLKEGVGVKVGGGGPPSPPPLLLSDHDLSLFFTQLFYTIISLFSLLFFLSFLSLKRGCLLSLAGAATSIIFVATNTFCCDKHTFVTTKACFVTTNVCLSWQNVCRDKNYTCGSSRQW